MRACRQLERSEASVARPRRPRLPDPHGHHTDVEWRRQPRPVLPVGGAAVLLRCVGRCPAHEVAVLADLRGPVSIPVKYNVDVLPPRCRPGRRRGWPATGEGARGAPAGGGVVAVINSLPERQGQAEVAGTLFDFTNPGAPAGKSNRAAPREGSGEWVPPPGPQVVEVDTPRRTPRP